MLKILASRVLIYRELLIWNGAVSGEQERLGRSEDVPITLSSYVSHSDSHIDTPPDCGTGIAITRLMGCDTNAYRSMLCLHSLILRDENFPIYPRSPIYLGNVHSQRHWRYDAYNLAPLPRCCASHACVSTHACVSSPLP